MFYMKYVLIASVLAGVGSATPVITHPTSGCHPYQPMPTPTQVLSNDSLGKLPRSNLTLQKLAIGRGTQNYTCTAQGSTPKAFGAIATLFDGTNLAITSPDVVHTIPPIIVNEAIPSRTFATANTTLSILGQHYFDSELTPVFDLSGPDEILFATKNTSVKPPSSATKGPAGTGAVDWLYLTAKPGAPSRGLQEVYRVFTAGGAAPQRCDSPGTLRVEYAAEYWFYN